MVGFASMLKHGVGWQEPETSDQISQDNGWGAAGPMTHGEHEEIQTTGTVAPTETSSPTAQYPDTAVSPVATPDTPSPPPLPSQPAVQPLAKIDDAKALEAERTIIGRNTVLEGVIMKSPEQDIIVYGAVSGTLECRSFSLEKGGIFEGRLVTTKSIEVAGVVRGSRLTSPEVRIIGSAVVGNGTLIVAQKYGQQLTARFDARVIADSTLTDDERMLILDDPDQYPHLPPKIDGSTVGHPGAHNMSYSPA